MSVIKNITNNKKIKILIFSVFITIVIIFQIIKSFSEIKEPPVVKISSGECNIQKNGCMIETDEFILRVLLDNEIYYLRPFNISISGEVKMNSSIDNININFKMVGMNMGVNRFALKTSSFSTKGLQNWQGKALLPICVTGRADWIADLEIVTKKTRYILSLPVTVQKTVN